MVKPRAQTLQQKLGFFDEDFKKPKHDELMLWLDSNIEDIVNKLFNQSNFSKVKEEALDGINTIINEFNNSIDSFQKNLELTEAEREMKSGFLRSDEELQQSILKLKKRKGILEKFNIDSEIPERPRIIIFNKKWEVPVTTGSVNNTYVVGFIDFSASFKIPNLELTGLKYTQKTPASKPDYYDFDENELKFKYVGIDTEILVEVKTEIKSLGELIRQINHYKSYRYSDFYVLCPDNKYKDILMEQGINSIDYNSKELP